MEVIEISKDSSPSVSSKETEFEKKDKLFKVCKSCSSIYSSSEEECPKCHSKEYGRLSLNESDPMVNWHW